MDWIRIPTEIPSDTDRRSIAGILTSVGLEVRIVKVKPSPGGNVKKFLEFREQDRKGHAGESGSRPDIRDLLRASDFRAPGTQNGIYTLAGGGG